MELRHIRYFVAAAEELNLRRAAARLHIAQPALSVQIHQLETEIKAQLFSRGGRGIKLTEAGRVFLEQSRQILNDVGRAVSQAQQAANGEIGHIRIGHNGPAELLVFPRIVPAFRKKWPQIHFSFENLRTPQQIERLRRDEIDIGFVWHPIPTDEFDVTELFDVPLVAVLPTENPLAKKAALTIKDLSNEPLIIFPRARDPESFHEIEKLFLDASATMNVVYEFDLMLAVVNFVAMGIGCGLLPDYSSRMHMPGAVYRPLKPPHFAKKLAIVKAKGSSGVTDSFYKFAIEKLSGDDVKTDTDSRQKRIPKARNTRR